MKKKLNKYLLSEKIKFESILVRENSIEVLKEFESIDIFNLQLEKSKK